MKPIECAKCGQNVAEIEPPSRIKKGASILGICYDCKNKNLRQGKEPYDVDELWTTFNQIFGGIGKQT